MVSVSRYSISSAVPFIIATAAQREGVDLGGRPEPLRPDEHVEIAAYLEVWRRALSLIGDPAFALRAALLFQLEDHEVFGFLAMSCQTLGQAYERTAAYRALYCIGARWELVREPEVARLIWYPWPGDVRDSGYRAAMDYAVADMEKAIRRLGRGEPRPLAVRLAHAAPPNVVAFAEFYGLEPKFEAPLYELVYPHDLPEMPIAGFNSKLRDYFDEECRKLVHEREGDTSAVEQLRRQLIGAMDGGDTSIEAMAKRLGQSSRSLQRRLAEEGTRYNDVLTGVREEFAKRYLSRGTVSASEVAYLLGFTEPPAFFKAFKRWTGMTPREFQEVALR